LPPGERAISPEPDAALLTTYLGRIAQATEVNRRKVREHAVQDYSTDRIASAIVGKLDELRSISVYLGSVALLPQSRNFVGRAPATPLEISIPDAFK